MLDYEVHNADEQTVSGQFGKEFARAVFALQPGAWHGPIESAYGLHLVRVSDREPAKRREFAEVKTQVLDDWREQRQREESERYFATLLKKYDVLVDANLKALVGPLVGPIAGQIDASGGEEIR
jgi:parvulin-like peptidyl-prolyl isomerase